MLPTLLSACGLGNDPNEAGHPSAAAPVSASAAPGHFRAQAVIYTRMGGKTGRTVSARITPGSSPRGYDTAEVRAILHAASQPALRSLHLPLMPQMLCCDRHVYTVHVLWSDGTKRTFRTADGLHQPAPLRRLLAALP
jgi:hypothetical protein